MGCRRSFHFMKEKCILSSVCQVILELCVNSKRASACVQKSSSSALVPRYRSNLIGTVALADEKSLGLEKPHICSKSWPYQQTPTSHITHGCCLPKSQSQDAKHKYFAMTHSHRDLRFACLASIDDVDLDLQTTISSHSLCRQPPQLRILHSI
jgi:hypothetical protein